MSTTTTHENGEVVEQQKPVVADQPKCEECRSEIFCCNYTINKIVTAYGKLLCPKCRENRPKLKHIRLYEIQERIEQIRIETYKLEQEHRDLVLEREDLEYGRNKQI